MVTGSRNGRAKGERNEVVSRGHQWGRVKKSKIITTCLISQKYLATTVRGWIESKTINATAELNI